MTRSALEVERCLALHAKGLTVSSIARELDIPRGTIKDWVAGRLPRIRGPVGPVCERCHGDPHRVDELPVVYAYLLGLYLGDGCVSAHHRGVYRLRLTLDSAYPGIIDEAGEAMRTIMPRSKVNKMPRPWHDVEVSSYSKSWPCLFPQHGPGKKHLRRILLTDWQQGLVSRAPELLLRGLIHSDGCRFINTGRKWSHPRYSFSNRSSDIRLIFTDACDLLGLHWTASPKA